MLQQLRDLLPSIPKLTPVAVVDILIVAFFIYQFLSIIRGRRAAHILNGLFLLSLAYFVALWLRLELLSTILVKLAPYLPIAVIVMFQSEIRRMLARIGRKPWLTLGAQLQNRETTAEIILAIQQLAQGKTGALIVLERDIGLRTFVESGVALDAQVSRDLLLSVFQNGSALHDGAVIVQGDRISAAACFLPLSINPLLMRKLGTRHRAAIGVTEETDCLSLVVSEETGRISIATGGEIEMDITIERLEDSIRQHFGRRKPVKHSPSSLPSVQPAAMPADHNELKDVKPS